MVCAWQVSDWGGPDGRGQLHMVCRWQVPDRIRSEFVGPVIYVSVPSNTETLEASRYIRLEKSDLMSLTERDLQMQKQTWGKRDIELYSS